MLYDLHNGQTSVCFRVKLRNSSVSTGAGLTGLTSASSGLIISTIADNEASATVYTVAASHVQTIATLGTYAAPSALNCRFKEVDATNHPGLYEVQLADARFAVSSAKSLTVSFSGATNLAECDVVIPLRVIDPYSSAFGLDLSAKTIGTVTTYTGNTPQTGDNFIRLGAPVGASISADIAAIKSETDTILTDVNTGGGAIYARIGAPAGASISADIAAAKASIGTPAQAATALSTAQWTNTRAGYLDNLSGGAVALASGVALTAAGLDAVVVEIGLNARQALSIIAAACGGTSSGVNAGSPVYKGAGVATTRITATASNGDRSSVTLAPPA